MKKESITKEIDWFCHHAVDQRLLSQEECVAVIEAIEEGGLTPELDLFISVVMDNNLCDDGAKIAKIKEMAVEEARFFGFSSRSVFDEGKQAPPPMPKRTAAAPQAQSAAEESQKEEPAPAPTPKPTPAGPGWTKGWPRLADAENLDSEAAQKLLNDFLHKAREYGCSDIHIAAGAVPFVRKYKIIYLLDDQEVLTAKASENLNLSPLTQEQLAKFETRHDLDYGYNITAKDRYRTNILHQRHGISGSYRVIDTEVKPVRQLGFKLPEVIEKLTTYGQGLILVTGPAGSGKSTTLASLVDYINKSRHDHIITVEDPIEVVHKSINCNVTQRELGHDTKSFANALRAALREDPDVIVIGELRDLETIEMAIHSSETGHLVIGTLHTSSAADTMNRVLDVFPHGQQAQIRAMLAESLKGVICQQLLPNKDGDGVVMAYEILLGILAVSNLIREGKTYQLESTIQTSRNLGMTTMEQCHFDLYMDGKRSYEQTLPYVKSGDLRRQMQMKEASALGGVPATGTAAKAAPAAPPEETQKKRRWFG